MLEKWKDILENAYNIGVLFMDLSKAFHVLNKPFLAPCEVGYRWIFSKIYDFYSKLLK